jgi:2-polyprenyl-3-methyl-5-hydroxy-6-metoxy-1,4-benzoquinol methylase
MYDWTKISTDPMNHDAHMEMQKFIGSILYKYDGSRLDLLRKFARDKTVLDIGAGEHDPGYFREDWEHQHLAAVAKSCTGLDIEQRLVDFYNNKGFKFICMDATSKNDIGERYDFIFCGDVIEHTNSPYDMICFVKRHLTAKGTAVITTPNPFSNFMKRWQLRGGYDFFQANLEHTCWITTTTMNELCRRAKMKFHGIYLHKSVIEVRNNQPGLQIDLLIPEFIFEIRK